jgi:hypothetical protein
MTATSSLAKARTDAATDATLSVLGTFSGLDVIQFHHQPLKAP